MHLNPRIRTSIRFARRPAIRLTLFAVASVILLAAAFRTYATWTHPFWQALGPTDLTHYLLATVRWLQTGTPYVAAEVAGPFVYGADTFLHPPISLPFFALFLVIPIQLYWIVPLATFAFLVIDERPAPWTWPVLAACLLIYPVGQAVWSGNTDIWAWAWFAAGLRWGWPLALLAIKPSVALVGLVGIRNRSTWKAAALVALGGLAFGGLWVDWVRVVANSPGTLLYSASNALMFAIPLVATIGSTRRPVLPSLIAGAPPSTSEPIEPSGRRRRLARPFAGTRRSRGTRSAEH